MRHALLVLCLATASLAADKPAPKTEAPKPAPVVAAATRTATTAGATTQGKGFGSFFKTLKERFLRRCQDPWAPDPAPGQ